MSGPPIVSMHAAAIYLLLGLVCLYDGVVADVQYDNSVSRHQMDDGLFYSRGTWPTGVDRDTVTPHSVSHCSQYANIDGEEGKTLDGYVLKQVHLILSPGQANVFASDTDIGSCDVVTDYHQSAKLVSFKEVISTYRMVQQDRHGFKEFYPAFGHECSNHYVTMEGFRKLVLIGEHLYHTYNNQPSHKLFLNSSHVHVESIPEPEQYQSLLSFLHGLLPEKDFTKTKVRKTSLNFCSTTESNLPSCHCSSIEEQSPFVMNAIKRGRYMFKDDFPNKDKLIQLVGHELGTQFSSVELFERLVHHCNRTSSVCLNGICTNLTKDMEDTLKSLVSNFLQKVHHDSLFQQFATLNAYPFLERLVHSSGGLRRVGTMWVYMGEQQFLEQLKTSLFLSYIQTVPVSPSRMAFEMYQRNLRHTEGSRWFVRVVSNGQEVPLDLPGCHGDWPKGLCPVDVVASHVADLRQQYIQECQIDT